MKNLYKTVLLLLLPLLGFSQNLIPNGSFESGISPWGGLGGCPIASYYFSAGNGLSITRNNASTTDFYIANNGNVGIGTNNPGNMKIAIEGTLGARAYRITQTNPWPDYVFDNKYELMPLNEIENFIQQNKHLPGIPSAKEINENKGYELGEMQILLLEKIEELYLHVIRLEKENNELRKILIKVD